MNKFYERSYMDIIVHPSNLKPTSLRIRGHKHSFVQIVAASIILEQLCTIKNVPLVEDVFVLVQIINSLGGKAFIRGHSVHIDPRNIDNYQVDKELMSKIHGTFYLIPALALKFRKFIMYKTGGDQIGSVQYKQERPHQHIEKILKHFDFFDYSKDKNYAIDIQKFSNQKEFLSGELTSSSTKIALLCSLTKQKTTILNPYLKTDVLDLLSFIKKCGYHVNQKKKSITIIQSKQDKDKNVLITLSDCSIEIISYISLALINDIPVKLKIGNGSFFKRIANKEITLLKRMGAKIKICQRSISVYPKNKALSPVDIVVLPTAFHSDHHPFFTLLLLFASGISTLVECVWRDRFGYTDELKKLSAKIERKDNKITIFPSILKPTKQPLNGLDTRASAVLIFAALTLKYDTLIRNVDHINRGYNNFWMNLKKMNANIEILDE